jgi:hypothetical protein
MAFTLKRLHVEFDCRQTITDGNVWDHPGGSMPMVGRHPPAEPILETIDSAI